MKTIRCGLGTGSLGSRGQWQWYGASGQLKDMAAGSLLLKLHERGLITLPPRRRAPVEAPSGSGARAV